MLVAADYPFLDVLWTMIIFFAWVAWIWIAITIFSGDIFRRHDISGGAKAAWVVLIIVLPFLGVLVLSDRSARWHARAQREAGGDSEGGVRRVCA